MRKIVLVIKYFKNLGVKNFSIYIIQRYISRHEIISINVKGLPEKVNFRNAPSDIQIFTQIFILKEYDISIEKPIFNSLHFFSIRRKSLKLNSIFKTISY